MNKSKKYVVLSFLAMAQGAVYFLPYIRNVYYTPMLNTMGVNNAQFGSLVSFFAIGCMILYIPGGILTDKWDYKKCITISLYTTAALVGSFAFFMNFAYARIVFFLMALSTTFVFWSAALKAVRIIGGKDDQGKTFGVYYAIQGLLSILLQNGMLFIYNSFADQALGLRVVLLINAGVNLIAGIGCQLFLEPQSKLSALSDKQSVFEFKMVGKVLKNPLIWIIAVLVFCLYGVYSNSYYYSTYLTTVKGLDEGIGAQLSLIRVTYMMFFASLAGGFVINKLKSTIKWYVICAGSAVLSTLTFILLMGTGMSPFILGVISILPPAFIFLVYGMVSSMYEEFGVPLAVTGTAVGIVSIIGYTPDLFFGPILGGILDAQGDAGYASLFGFFLVIGIVGFLAGVLAMVLNKRRKAKEAAAGIVHQL